jgi:hypothetical protein
MCACFPLHLPMSQMIREAQGQASGGESSASRQAASRRRLAAYILRESDALLNLRNPGRKGEEIPHQIPLGSTCIRRPPCLDRPHQPCSLSSPLQALRCNGLETSDPSLCALVRVLLENDLCTDPDLSRYGRIPLSLHTICRLGGASSPSCLPPSMARAAPESPLQEQKLVMPAYTWSSMRVPQFVFPHHELETNRLSSKTSRALGHA